MRTTDISQRNVCSIIVPNDLCSGCGVCAGVCSGVAQALQMEWNAFGEYVPAELPSKCIKCGRCLAACPFWNQQEDETAIARRLYSKQDAIQYHSVIGYYLGLYAGYSRVNDHRRLGAGGGLCTWFLEKLLTSGIVDKVCCVLPSDIPGNLFAYAVVDDVATMRMASRSKYYPVEISRILSEASSSDHKYAIVGLPCVLKGVRLAMKNEAHLSSRIGCLVGLVCGQQKSRFFAEYLCAMGGGTPGRLKSAAFRVKDERLSHLDHRFEFLCSDRDNSDEGAIHQSEGMGSVWGNDYFKLNACNYCDDICAEVADVSFGDAVAEEYSYGNLGANFVVARNQMTIDILTNAASSGEIMLESVPQAAIIERQKGVILNKRQDLAHRLHCSSYAGRHPYILRKRWASKRRYNVFRNIDMWTRDRIRQVSRSVFADLSRDGNVVAVLERKVRWYKTLRRINSVFASMFSS